MKSKTTAMIAIFAVIVIVITLMYISTPKKTPPPTFAPADTPTSPIIEELQKRILYYRENGFEGVLPRLEEV